MNPHRSLTPRQLGGHRRLADRLFLGGCVAAYMVLMASVVTALNMYGG